MVNGKPNTTKADVANAEPKKDEASPTEKTATVVGATTEILETVLNQGEKLADNAAKAARAGSEEAAQLGGVAKQAGALGTTMKVFGKAAGVVSAYNAWSEAVEKGGAGRYTKAVVETALVFIKTNPIVGVGIALADLTGLTDKLFEW